MALALTFLRELFLQGNIIIKNILSIKKNFPDGIGLNKCYRIMFSDSIRLKDSLYIRVLSIGIGQKKSIYFNAPPLP